MRILVLDERETFERVVDCESNDDHCEIDYCGRFFFSKPADFFSRYDFVFYRNFYDELNQLAACQAIKAGVRVAFFSDGIFEWANSHRDERGSLWAPLVATDVFAMSDFCFVYLLHRNRDINTYKYTPRNAEAMKTQQEKETTKQFLITTANTPYFNEQEFGLLVELFEKLTNHLSERGFSFGFRIRDDRLQARLGLNERSNYLEGSFDDVMADFDSLITTPSTVAITAMRMNKPVCQLRYRDDPISFSTGWNLFSSQSIDSVIDAMSRKDAGRMEFQEMQLSLLDPIVHDVESVVEALSSEEPPDRNLKKIEIDRYIAKRYYSVRYLIYRMITERIIYWFNRVFGDKRE